MSARHVLRITSQDAQAMLAEILRHLPEEACGLLGGRGEQAEAVYPIANRLHSTLRFEMDPQEQVAAFLRMDALGQELVGIFHSHPCGPTDPSATDLAESYYPEAVYIIWSPQEGGGWQARGFRLANRQAREVELRFTGTERENG